jgi:hypothetical protein
MKIEIKLDDPRYCDNCPLNYDDQHCQISIDWSLDSYSKRNIVRPQECIDKHGK